MRDREPPVLLVRRHLLSRARENPRTDLDVSVGIRWERRRALEEPLVLVRREVERVVALRVGELALLPLPVGSIYGR